MKLCKRSHIPGQNKIKQNKKKQAKNKKHPQKLVQTLVSQKMLKHLCIST